MNDELRASQLAAEVLIAQESDDRRNRMLCARSYMLSLTDMERRTVFLSLDDDISAIHRYCADVHAQNMAIG